MAIPIKYRKSPEVLANYSFVDILSDVGYVTVFGIMDEADTRSFSRLAIDSKEERRLFTSTGGLEGEDNFDFTFNLPVTIKGDLYLTLTYFARAIATQSADCFLKIRVMHFDGSTETVIGTQQTTDTITQTVDSTFLWQRTTLLFDLTRKFFARGDKLRVEIEVHSTLSTNAACGYYHDGNNKDFAQEDPVGTSVGSNLICQIPLVLDL